MRSASLVAVVFATMLAGACDESFSPIQPSDLQFSVFGVLDASADTQWIRVMPVRPLVVTGPGPLGATVTVEHLGTGRIIQMRDSAFRFTQHNAEVGSEGLYLHNYWTTERIEPGATYRLSAQRDGGPPAEAVVEIPGDYEVELWISQPGSFQSDLLWISGLKHVALAGAVTYYADDCGFGQDSLTFRVFPPESGIAKVGIGSRAPRPRTGCGRPFVERREVWVVGSVTPWPSGRDYAAGRLGITKVPSNITNSVGFVGGVLTKVIPYGECGVVGSVFMDYCRLPFTPASVTLRGRVRDLVCGGEVRDAIVALRELEPEPTLRSKVRQTRTGRTGGYEIGLLDAGKRYAMSVRRLSPAGFDMYEEYGDTLQFAPGEQATHDVGLRPVDPCPTAA